MPDTLCPTCQQVIANPPPKGTIIIPCPRCILLEPVQLGVRFTIPCLSCLTAINPLDINEFCEARGKGYYHRRPASLIIIPVDEYLAGLEAAKVVKKAERAEQVVVEHKVSVAAVKAPKATKKQAAKAAVPTLFG